MDEEPATGKAKYYQSAESELAWTHWPRPEMLLFCFVTLVKYYIRNPLGSGFLKMDIQLTKSIPGSLYCCCSVTQSCLTLYNPMDCSTPGLPVLLSPRVCSNSCPLSQWCHPTISSSITPFSSCPQSFPASINKLHQTVVNLEKNLLWKWISGEHQLEVTAECWEAQGFLLPHGFLGSSFCPLAQHQLFLMSLLDLCLEPFQLVTSSFPRSCWCLEINPCTYDQLIYDQGGKGFQGVRENVPW